MIRTLDAAANPEVPAENGFAELRQRVKSAGLLDRQPRYYTLTIAFTVALMAISIGLFFVIDNFWVLLAVNAPFMAFSLGQVGFISHDSGHRQIFTKTRGNEIVAVTSSFVLGLSRSWWIEKHNKHHSNPNQADMDPDIEIIVLAFSEEQALARRGIFRFMVRRQAQIFPLVLFLQGFSLRVSSVLHMLRNRVRYPLLEPLSMIVHLSIYLGILLFLLEPWQALVFFVVNQALWGFYLASVFAPNHKGMLMLERDTELDYLRRQVLTARNVKGHPLTDFWYGGLNYQIEHHLFPTMARNNLGKTQKLVKQFCAERGISYHEVGMLRSYVEIIEFLHRVSLPLRRKQTAGALA